MVGDNKDHGHAAEGVGEGCELVIGHHLVSMKLNAKGKNAKGVSVSDGHVLDFVTSKDSPR